MLASFFAWWIARITELLPRSWTIAGAAGSDGILVTVEANQSISAVLRRKGRHEAVTLGIASRLAARKPVSLRPPPEAVLEKHHVVPTAPRRELNQLLRFELPRITPFRAEDLFWGWDGHLKQGDRSRTDVTLTMVPKAAVALAFDALDQVGIQPRFIEVGPQDRPHLLRTDNEKNHADTHLLNRALAGTCAALAISALMVPVVRQEIALRSTINAIDALRPTIREVEALRRGITADGAGQEVLERERQRTGDLLQVLATVTRILPDDTYLTDFSLRERQMTLGGRSAAAPRLITGLSADPMIRNAAFTAPVTRIEGASTDVFSIRTEIAP